LLFTSLLFGEGFLKTFAKKVASFRFLLFCNEILKWQVAPTKNKNKINKNQKNKKQKFDSKIR
jgi:hypothetical protein